jgi:hypothetical protein
MGRSARAACLALVAGAAIFTGCSDRTPVQVCAVPFELRVDELPARGFEGADLLFVIDDSASMAEEQAILATSFFPLVDALANPIRTDSPETSWPYPAIDELRVAVITSNMGLSSNGESNDDLWPGADAPAGCHDLGDDGQFRGIESSTVEVRSDVIPCDESAAQCPPDWTCENIGADTGVGVCHADGVTAVACPGLGAAFAETSRSDPNAAFPIQSACLAQQGSKGCGFEQPLAAAATALVRSDQKEFVDPTHLLAVIVVSDEDDCSIEDGVGFFSGIELTDPASKTLDLACADRTEHLFDVGHFHDALTDAKSLNGLVFVAIAGVPYEEQDPEGAAACQGRGDDLGECLEQDAMQPVAEEPGEDIRHYRPVCTRSENENEVTRAYPGRRYVELAYEHFGSMSFVYSICNPDWSPALEDVARFLASCMCGPCYKKPLPWNPATRTADCNLVVEYEDEGEACPAIFGGVEPIVDEEASSGGEEITRMFCPVPKIPFARSCADQDPPSADEFGWYYCENLSAENFAEACNDGVDNDGDGLTDCDDPECADCLPCPGATGNDCSQACKYIVALTEATEAAVAGRQASVQCLRRFSNEDRNCQEDTHSSCNDGADNDGDGRVDCVGDAEHGADPHCCPMSAEPGEECDLSPDGVDATYDEICPADEVPYADGYPDACREAAARLGCTLP